MEVGITIDDKKALNEVEKRWKTIADLIIDLKRREVAIPDKVLVSFTCCRSLINHCKHHLRCSENRSEYRKTITELCKELLDIESCLIMIALDKLGEEYVMRWTTRLNGNLLELGNGSG